MRALVERSQAMYLSPCATMNRALNNHILDQLQMSERVLTLQTRYADDMALETCEDLNTEEFSCVVPGTLRILGAWLY